MCLGGYMAEKHHFFLGTTEEGVEKAVVGDRRIYQFTTVEGNMFQLRKMKKNTTYYWRVDAERNGQIFKGDVWNFVTDLK